MKDKNLLGFIKYALINILNGLGDQNRFSLVVLSDKGRRKCPLVRGKERIKLEINSLNELDLTNSTNLTAGIIQSLRILKERRYSIQASSLLLFTDEKNDIENNSYPLCKQEIIDSELERFRVCSFDFGENVDKHFLKKLTYEFRGEYYQLNNIDQMQSVVSLALGNLTSVIARDLEVNLETLDSQVPCDVIKVYSTDGTKRFIFPSLEIKEQRHLIFLLRPCYKTLHKDLRCLSVKVELSYIDNESGLSSKFAFLDVKFVKSSIPSLKDIGVYVNWYSELVKEARQKAEQLMSESLLEETDGNPGFY